VAERRDRRAVWAQCERVVGAFSPADVDPRSTLLALAERAPSNEGVDRYGEGALAERLEARVAALLGKEAAVWMPSGTMVQQIALRIHCDRSANRRIAFHPTCHLDVHEERGYAHLHGLHAHLLGSRERLPTPDDLDAVREPLGAVVLELPARELGGQLPPWDELTAFCARARERGIALHMDGARLWQCSPFYERSFDEIAALFDTVYVSFYKGIGALPGCCVAGSEQDIAQVREWRSRLGGTLFAMWPNASSALGLLDTALAEMPARLQHARAIAAALSGVPEVRVVPDPPQTPMMHLLLSVPGERYRANAKRLAEETALWVWPSVAETGDPAVVRAELSVGRATLRHKPEAIAEILAGLCL
jgi:threonine aldolase